MNDTALVVTSIASPNTVLKELADGALENGWDFYCIGDMKSPNDFHISGCDFISYEEQITNSKYRISKLLPKNHYSRKNHGYLKAIHTNIKYIVETDDDNSPMQNFWSQRSSNFNADVLNSSENWVNVYSYYTDQKLWPRGLPLNYINKQHESTDLINRSIISPVQQSLANGDTDVDAIYRLIVGDEVIFNNRESPIALAKNICCPFNSQSTTWNEKAFKLMYLPSYCSFRMTDIWRSFVVQACLWVNDWHLTFHNPTVHQERNEHNLMHDFEDEIPGYLNNEKILEGLMSLPLLSGEMNLLKNLMLCYEHLISMGFIDGKEEKLLEAWVDDVQMAQHISG